MINVASEFPLMIQCSGRKVPYRCPICDNIERHQPNQEHRCYKCVAVKYEAVKVAEVADRRFGSVAGDTRI